MSVILTQEQRQAILESGGAAVEVADGDVRCILIAADKFARMQQLIEAEEIDPSFYEFDDEDFDTGTSDKR